VRSSSGVRTGSIEEARVQVVSVPRGVSTPVSKPKGGYQLIPALRLAMAWRAYREKLIRLVDLRVWFAAWEMRARRCRTPSPLPRRFGLDELRQLTGLSIKRLKASLRRLEAAGLLAWAEAAIAFPGSPEAVPFPDRDGFRRFLDSIPNHRRLVPVPRRILRLLAGGARPALIATILGHLFRCLYAKGGKCLPVGRVKASWIAHTFGIGLRRVKQARQELIALGWLIPLQSRQWALNRWGALIRINLDWSRLDGLQPAAGAAAAVEPGDDGAENPPPAPAPGPELAPPPPDSGPKLAPPDSDEEPLTGAQNQEPASGGPAGFYSAQPEEETPEPKQVQPESVAAMPQAAAEPAAISRASGHPAPSAAPAARPCPAPQVAGPVLGRPNLRDVVPEDLKDTGRLLELYEQAVDAGLAPPSEWGRLRFVAAAEHARVIGTKNPCGLFVRLVRGGLYHFATGDDEQAASVRLRKHLYGPAREGSAQPERPVIRSEPLLSADARLVEAVLAAATRARYRGDAFPLLKRAQPEWTRERWDRAQAELDGHRRLGA
jgi:hypothetical protein